MIQIENRGYSKTKIVPNIEFGGTDCIITYSKRAAEFAETDFDKKLSDVFKQVRAFDDFGIVMLQHNEFCFLVEHTNIGFSVRAFINNHPDFSLYKLAYGLKLRDLFL